MHKVPFMAIRFIQTAGGRTVTSALLSRLREAPASRQESLALARGHMQ